MKSIDVKCTGNDSKELEELIELQGNLKVLTDDNYSKLKKGIIELGFLEPVTIWRDRNEILNGHQRVTTLRRMADEGYSIPSIPVNSISVEDKAEAKRVILALTSQYGSMTEGSLAEFLKEAAIDIEDVLADYSFAGIDEDVLESTLASIGIDESYVEKYEDEADKFESVVGKARGKKKHLILYVELASVSDFDRVQNLMCDRKTQKMSPERFLEAAGLYESSLG